MYRLTTGDNTAGITRQHNAQVSAWQAVHEIVLITQNINTWVFLSVKQELCSLLNVTKVKKNILIDHYFTAKEELMEIINVREKHLKLYAEIASY